MATATHVQRAIVNSERKMTAQYEGCASKFVRIAPVPIAAKPLGSGPLGPGSAGLLVGQKFPKNPAAEILKRSC